MSATNIYHLVPRDGQWAARLQGSPTVSVQADTREAALEQTERLLRQLGSGRIILHDESGAIESVHTFEQIASGAPEGWTQTLLSTPVLIGAAAACLIGLGFALRGRR